MKLIFWNFSFHSICSSLILQISNIVNFLIHYNTLYLDHYKSSKLGFPLILISSDCIANQIWESSLSAQLQFGQIKYKIQTWETRLKIVRARFFRAWPPRQSGTHWRVLDSRGGWGGWEPYSNMRAMLFRRQRYWDFFGSFFRKYSKLSLQ